MANPSTIRPTVLNAPIPNTNPAVQINEKSKNRIAAICEQQRRNLVQAIINPNNNDRYRNGLSDLDKIPDFVKSFRDFSANPMEFNSWKKSVDRVLQISSITEF